MFVYKIFLDFFFSDKFLAFSGPHNKSRIENGKHANFGNKIYIYITMYIIIVFLYV